MSRADHNLVRIGQVLKTNGADGEVVIGFRDIDFSEIDQREPVFIFYDDTPVPFFIENCTPRGNSKVIARLSDICCNEDSEEIVGKAVYIDSRSLGDEYENEEDMSFLIGWTLYQASANGENGSATQDKATSGKGRASQNHVGRFEAGHLSDDVRVGEITDFLDFPGNPCIAVDAGGNTVTIPLHEDLVISIDPDSRSIVMDIPAGLLFL